MKVLFVVVVVMSAAAVVCHATAFRNTPPNSMDWDEDSGGYPDVGSDFEEENSDEDNLKLDRHSSAPVIYRSPSRVVYAHHASQADPLEDTSDENYDIGEHAPGPPTYKTPNVYNSNIYENKQDEVSEEESKGPQFMSAPSTFGVDTSSLEYIPPPRPPTYQTPNVYNSNIFESKQDEVSEEEFKGPQFMSSPVTFGVDTSSLEYIPPPGPPTYQTPNVYNSNILESKQDEVSEEEFIGPQFMSSPVTFGVDTSSREYIPPPVVYSPPLPMLSAYMNPKPIPVVSRGYFSESPVSRAKTLMSNPPSSPRSPTFVYNNPAPSPFVYNPPTPAPYVFSGPNSNAAIYTKPPSAQVVYKYALPSPFVNKEEESFPLSKQILDYDEDNKPEPMIYDSSVYSPSIDSQSTFAPYKYSDLITPSNAFADYFSSQPLYNLNSLNHISPGLAKPEDSHSFLNLYEEPKKYSIEPFPISSLEKEPESIIYENPVPISNAHIDSEDHSEIYKDLKDSADFDDIEYEDVDHDILDAIPATYNEPKSQSSNNNAKDIQTNTKSINFSIEYEDVDHDILDAIPVTYNEPKSQSSNNNVKDIQSNTKSIDFSIEYEDVDHDILDAIPVTYNEPKLQSSNNNIKDIQTNTKSIDFSIEYEDVDHDILDAIPVTYNEPKSQSSNNNVKDIQTNTKSIDFNISYQTDFKSKSSEEIISKLPEVKIETTTATPKVIITETTVKNSIKNQNINDGTTGEASKITKVPHKIVNQVKSTSLNNNNRLSTFSSRRSQQRSPLNYSHRMSVLRESLRESQRQRYRDRSSEEKRNNVYSFRSRLRYRTRGSPENFMKRRGRPLRRMYHHHSSENISSEERIYNRRGTLWGRRRQSRQNQSSEEDDDDDDYKITRFNTRRLSERTTTIKPKTTTSMSKPLSSISRGRYENRNRDRHPTRQSLQCFLMSIIRANYRC